MGLRHWMREHMWIFSRPNIDPASREAMKAAEASHLQAAVDLHDARRIREESDQQAARLAQHNAANRYDEWLLRKVQGHD